jgi:hypothetical protein
MRPRSTRDVQDAKTLLDDLAETPSLIGGRRADSFGLTVSI